MELFLKYSAYFSLIIGSCFLILSMPTLYQVDEDIDVFKFKMRFYIGFVFISMWLIYIFFISL